ncbi:sensor histidine kinase [Plebeiibacterium marinum]|uniref:Sensor histidine kinase n=1 Tax=Plebeiibacterium marinum TaxID=2992111 RepID=A0AAE3MFS6_9BACT|nr:sensor histidine kinase [Plebeiobacterium marinum]MCW3807019.1 sensor histidine kinase [Plebeiobacterium marinum]
MSKNFLFILILVYLVVGVISFVSILNHNFKTDSKNKELENKILATQLQMKEQELNYLKRQIHPHFLFNTLNTIYGFAIQQSKYTPDIILKLSNLLDYILYQINKPVVNLKEEVLHIEEYIGLEKMRFSDTLRVQMNASNLSNKHKIPPMLLIPFVENAFKHGQMVDGFLSINIHIDIIGDQLAFTIKNSVKELHITEGHHGLGLENIKKRLQLYYPNRYKLEVEHGHHWYKVELKIDNLKDLSHE